MIVDGLAYLGESIQGYQQSVDELLAYLDGLRIDRAVVVPVKPPGYHLEPENERVAAAAQAHPDRLVGFARVDPLRGESAAREVERGAAELGLRGLFLHPWEETFRIHDERVVRLLDGFALPVIVAAGYPWLSEGAQVAELARRLPAVAVVATNGCQLNSSGLGQTDAELALAANANLCAQTTGVYREDFLEGIVARFGAERLLYASGFPLFDPLLEVLRARWAPGLDDRAKALVLGGNAERLLLGSSRPAAR